MTQITINFVALLKGKFTHPHVITILNYTFKDNILAMCVV